MSKLQDVDASISFPKEEEKILAYWKEIDAFKTSVKLSEGKKPFSFYDGPPFATGYVIYYSFVLIVYYIIHRDDE